MLEALNVGALDFGVAGETPPIFAQAAGAPLVYLAYDPPAPQGEAILVPRDSPLKSVADLRGKSPYEYVVLDSGVETAFAEHAETNSAVEVFVKFPDWFTIPTPLGPYNPDWALQIRNDNGELKYRVVETKGSSAEEDLREREKEKIACARAHFGASRVMESPAEYVVATTLDEVVSGAASAA